jgi:hypothetical protein
MAIKTFTTGEVLTAADTNTYLANSGLVYIAGATFSGITSGAPLDVNSVFSSTYTNYLLLLRSSQTVANGAFQLRMRTVAAQYAGAAYDYGWGGSYVNATPTYFFGAYSATNPFAPDTSFWTGMTAANGYSATSKIDIMSPNEARETRIFGQGYTNYQGTYYNVAVEGSGNLGTTTQYTGFRIFPVSGTSAGEYQLYGYRIA